MSIKKVLVCGAGGFIGHHLVTSLCQQGHYVVAADMKLPAYGITQANEFHQVDLRNQRSVRQLITADLDEIYQLAADMGGAAFVFSGANDADIMHNSALINLNVLHEMTFKKVKRIFYSSSACIYPERNQMTAENPVTAEDSAYPAAPDSEYGWEKLFSERLYQAYQKNYGLDVRIARLHNVFGPQGAWTGGREKSPAALCRKVSEAESGGVVEVWGSGQQTRSYLYVDECVEGIHRLMASNYAQPINIGSARMISVNDLVHLIAGIAGKSVQITNVPGPTGVMGRTSDNTLIKQVLGWEPPDNLEHGIRQLYNWIELQRSAQT
jgi:nucleoside-diphosphate-sugar epimerase